MTEKNRWDLALGATKFVLAVLTSMVTAIWAVTTWREETARTGRSENKRCRWPGIAPRRST